jgi:KaiC/GvpD/RAD55 family RecA-like ATPase
VKSLSIALNRVKTGIPGVDELIEGGFPEGSSILLSGAAGAGKSIFCLQYLYYGAKEQGEPGVYITLEEGPHNLWWNMQRFKWDLLPLERDNLLKIYKFEPGEDMQTNANEQIKRIVEKVKEIGAKRLVIDSISAFSYWFIDENKTRYVMYNLVEELRKLNCTTIITCETRGGKSDFSQFGVEEFLSDGLLMLYFIAPQRLFFVRKMRGTNHDKNVHAVTIDDTGISVNSKEGLEWSSLKD